MAIPFNVSGEAETYLSEILANPPAGDFEPALIWSSRYTIDDQEVGASFTVGYYPRGKRPRDSFFSLLGRSISIVPSTLEKLEGKTLVLERRKIGGQATKRVVKVLLASAVSH